MNQSRASVQMGYVTENLQSRGFADVDCNPSTFSTLLDLWTHRGLLP